MSKKSEGRGVTQQTSRKLGASGPEVFPIALGCMGMSGMYGESREEEGIATIHAALERGVTLLDTGDFYGMGHNEQLIRRALQGRKHQAQLSVKFGALRGPDGRWTGIDTRPAAIANFVAYSLNRLGVEVIDVYRPARLDPTVPIEETIGAIADLVKRGYVRHIGLSEVGPETVRRAHAVHPIVDLQIEYSIVSRAPEAKIFPLLEELDIGATLYSVLGRGLLGGKKAVGPEDMRAHLPRFAPEHRAKNERIVEAFTAFARARSLSPGQLAVSWALAKQPRFVPVVGARTPAQLEDALGALEHPLSAEDARALEAEVPAEAIAGARYAPQQMEHLDSER